MTSSEYVTEIDGKSEQSGNGVGSYKAGTKPVRILHVVGGMDRGGVETWLMHVLRHIDRERFQMDFLVHTDRHCDYDDEIKALGSNIYFCASPSNPIRYAMNFRSIVREHGPYDVVHSHVHHFSGFVLWLAKAAGVKRRIAHSHSDTKAIDSRSSFQRTIYLGVGCRWIAKYASFKLAVSGRAAEALYGRHWSSDPQAGLLYCGIDFDTFESPIDKMEVRTELALDVDDFVIGHVGRFAMSKNHDFLLRVHAEVLKREPKARLLLVGKGPLEADVRALAKNLGTTQSIRFTGTRPDVPRLMRGAMDVFVFPSLYEGFGLAAIEAQAAGLPTILSESVPHEADAGCDLVRFVPVTESHKVWAETILASRRQVSTSQAEAVKHLQFSQFGIRRNVEALTSFYQGRVVKKIEVK